MASTAHSPPDQNKCLAQSGDQTQAAESPSPGDCGLDLVLFPSSMLPRLATGLGVSTVGEIHDPLEDLLGVEPSPWTPRWENLMGLEDSLWVVGSSGPS